MARTILLLGLCSLLALAPAAVGSEEGGEDETGKSGWSKNKLTFESADRKFTLHLANRVQIRFTHEDPELGEDRDSFRVRRYKFKLEGLAFGDWQYKLQANFAGGSAVLEDAYFQYRRNPWLQPWIGQGKVFFGRQELTSSGKQQFVDRSEVSERFAPSRDQGFALVGASPNQTFEYQVGVYNGNGPNRRENDNDDLMTAARVVFAPLGEYDLAEGAIDYPATPRLAIGAAGLATTQGAGAAEVDIERVNLELAFKVRGFSLVGEYYGEEASPVAGARVDTDGYYLQVGYLFPGRRFEVAGRLGEISLDLPGPSRDQTETGVAVNYYWSKHDYKIQADLRRLEDELAGTEDDELRVQLQWSF